MRRKELGFLLIVVAILAMALVGCGGRKPDESSLVVIPTPASVSNEVWLELVDGSGNNLGGERINVSKVFDEEGKNFEFQDEKNGLTVVGDFGTGETSKDGDMGDLVTLFQQRLRRSSLFKDFGVSLANVYSGKYRDGGNFTIVSVYISSGRVSVQGVEDEYVRLGTSMGDGVSFWYFIKKKDFWDLLLRPSSEKNPLKRVSMAKIERVDEAEFNSLIVGVVNPESSKGTCSCSVFGELVVSEGEWYGANHFPEMLQEVAGFYGYSLYTTVRVHGETVYKITNCSLPSSPSK